MTNTFCRTTLGLLASVTLLAGGAYADTFEFLTYTPPRGWINQTSEGVSAYRRPTGIGLITFSQSYPATGSASGEFARMWRARVEPTLPGPAPQPQLRREGEYTVAVGQRQVDAQGTLTTLALVAIVGQGRAIGVLTLTAGDEALREVTTFLDSIILTPVKPAATTPKSGPAPAGAIEVDFEVPPGYVPRHDGRMVLLIPTTIDQKTPCAYGISPSRPSSGTLETDARAALLEPHPGWQLKDDSYNAMRGAAGDGWEYFWFRAVIQSLVGGSYQYVNAMAMAFPAGQGRVNIIWGVGNTAHCLADDLAFARLFHSLRPRGWSTDGGKALARDLRGMWRNSQRLGIAQYKFMADGRYEFGIGTVTRTGLLERTSSSVSDGRYELRGAELTITPDRRDRGATKYRVRIYDEFVRGRWTRAMSLLDEGASPALEVQYMRVENSP